MRGPAWSLPLLLLLASSAWAEVTREQPIVENTGYTLNRGEWKIGLRESAYGLSDRLQFDSNLLLNVGVLNAGLKYQLVDAPNLALAVRAFGGGSALALVLKMAMVYGGARMDASFPMTDRLSFGVGAGWTLWSVGSVGSLTLLSAGRLSWWSVRAGLQWVIEPRHVLFIDFATPTSWLTSLGPGSHDFDALDFANGMVRYQFSRGISNLRVGLGWGPSLLGRGPTADFDFYLRF